MLHGKVAQQHPRIIFSVAILSFPVACPSHERESVFMFGFGRRETTSAVTEVRLPDHKHIPGENVAAE